MSFSLSHIYHNNLFLFFPCSHTAHSTNRYNVLHCICNAELIHRMQMIPSGKSLLVNSLFQFHLFSFLFAARATEVTKTSFKTHCNLSTVIHASTIWCIKRKQNCFFLLHIKREKKQNNHVFSLDWLISLDWLVKSL